MDELRSEPYYKATTVALAVKSILEMRAMYPEKDNEKFAEFYSKRYRYKKDEVLRVLEKAEGKL